MEEQQERSKKLAAPSPVKKRKTGDDGSGEVLEVFGTVPPNQKKATSGSPILDKIIEVIPDCEVEHARSICSRFGVKINQAVEEENLQNILMHLLEDGYKKDSSKRNPAQLHVREVIAANSNAAAAIGAAGKKYSRDFDSIHGELSNVYKREVISLVLAVLPRCSCTKDDIVALLMKFNFHFAPCIQMICDKLTEIFKREDATIRIAELVPEIIALRLSEELKVPDSSGASPLMITDELLNEEIQFVMEKQREAMDVLAKKNDRLTAREEAQASSSLVECACCYCSFAPMEMVTCTGEDAHLFCMDCLARHAQTQLFELQNTTLKCMHQGTGNDACFGEFSYRELKRSLSNKVLLQYDKASADTAIKAAGLKNIAKCPQCEFQAELPMSEKIFRCPAVGCHFESCRYCGEEPHLPLKCSEARKTKKSVSRRKIEEAMTAARVRECPDCGNRFFKEEGCNKITCKCKAKICYLCRKKIADYTHFCQKFYCKHENCGKCALYTNSIEDDRLAVKKAGESATKQIFSANSGGKKRKAHVASRGGRTLGRNTVMMMICGEVESDEEQFS